MAESEILAFRVAQLENEHKILREELHGDYLDRHQLMNEYITRGEHQRHAAVRREWPLILAGVLVALNGFLDTILMVTKAGG